MLIADLLKRRYSGLQQLRGLTFVFGIDVGDWPASGILSLMASLTQFSLLEALAFGFKSPDSIVAGISSSAARSSFCTS
jgi:hypothetical protein